MTKTQILHQFRQFAAAKISKERKNFTCQLLYDNKHADRYCLSFFSDLVIRCYQPYQESEYYRFKTDWLSSDLKIASNTYQDFEQLNASFGINRTCFNVR